MTFSGVAGCRLQTVGHGVEKGIDPGADIDEIDQQHVDRLEHRPRRVPAFAIEAVERQAGAAIGLMRRFHHIVLLLGEKTVLRRKQAGQPGAEFFLQQQPSVPQMAVGRGLVGQQSQPFAGKLRPVAGQQSFKSNLDHKNLKLR